MQWVDLKRKVFSYLELPRNTTGDVEDAVKEALFDTYTDIVTDINPLILLTTAGPVALSYPATTLDIQDDFITTPEDDDEPEVAEIHAIGVNLNPNDVNSKSLLWDEISWERWLKQDYNPSSYQWAVAPDDVIHFTSTPQAAESWDVTLHFIRKVADYSDVGTPEINEIHHNTIAYGAATMFPQYFAGAREQLFQKFTAKYQSGINRILRKKRSNKALKTLKIRGGVRRRSRDVTFGSVY